MDTVTSVKSLDIEAGFVDGDTRKFSVPDPNTAIYLSAGVKNLRKWVKEKNFLIGDKAGADFAKFNSAKLTYKTTTKLDIS